MLATSGLGSAVSVFGLLVGVSGILVVLFFSKRYTTLTSLQTQTIAALQAQNEAKVEEVSTANEEIRKRDEEIKDLRGRMANMEGQLETLQGIVTQRENVEKLLLLETKEHEEQERRHTELMATLAKFGVDRRSD